MSAASVSALRSFEAFASFVTASRDFRAALASPRWRSMAARRMYDSAEGSVFTASAICVFARSSSPALISIAPITY